MGNGAITDGNKGLVNGGVVKTYVDSKIENSTNTINATLDKKLNTEDLDVTGDGKYIDVTNEDTTKKKYKVAFKESALKQLVNDTDITDNTYLKAKLDDKADKNASNLTETDVTKWQEKLGNGSVTKGDTKLVKGGTVFTYVDNIANTIKQELSTKATGDLTKKLDVDAKNISTDGVNNLTTKLGVGVVAENNTGLVTGGKVYSELNKVKEELNKSISTNTQNITDLNNKYTTLNNQVTTNTNDISKLKTTVNDLKNTKQDITKINTKLGDIDNSITTINNKLDGKLDKTDLSITGDEYIGVKKDNKFNYTLSFNKDTLANDLDLTNNTSVNNMFTTKLGNINTNIGDLKTKVESNTNNINSLTTKVNDNTDKISNLTTKVDNNTNDITTLKQDMTKKLNVDADNLTDKGVTNLTDKLSKGSDISKPNNRLVTDEQVNTYLSRYNDALGVVDKKSTVALEKSELALGGVANAVAMANLVQVNSYSRHRHNLSAAYGYYGGAHALAVGFSGTNEERNFVYKLSGSVNNKGNLAFGVGAGVMLGEEHDTFPNIDNKKIKEVTKKLDEANKKISEYEDDKKQTAKKFKELEDKYENDKKESNKKLQEMERKLEMLMKKFK